MAANYQLTFHGSAGSPYRIPSHRVNHMTLEGARSEAARVDARRSGDSRAACPAVVISPTGETLSAR